MSATGNMKDLSWCCDQYYDDCKDYVHDLQRRRDAAAKKIREFRTLLRKNNIKLRMTNDLMRNQIRGYPMVRTTPQALREHALDLWNHAQGPMPYLPCGADNAYGERQAYNESNALAIWRSVGRFD